MDLNSIAQFIKTHILEHTPFIFTAFILGMVGQFFKTKVWTKERAEKGKLWWWLRATLPFHPILTGIGLGLLFGTVFKDTAPASLGVEGTGELVMYYAGAGALSVIVYNIVRNFAKSRGISLKLPNGKSEPPEPPESK
jgi:nucleoside recognition membrane protein YjiH